MKSPFNYLLSVVFCMILSAVGSHMCMAADTLPAEAEAKPEILVDIKTTGLSEKLVVMLNDQESLIVKGNGLSAFKKPMQVGDNYQVKILKQPLNHNCELKNEVGKIEADTKIIVEAECRETGRWSSPILIAEGVISGRNKYFNTPSVAINNKGNGLAVWTELDKEGWSRVAVKEFSGGKWQKKILVSPADGDAKKPQMIMTGNGDAVVVWEHLINSRLSLVMKAERRNGVWQLPKSASDRISVGEKNRGWEAQVAVNDSGQTIIVWSQAIDDPMKYGIYKSEYINGKWQHPKDINDHISPNGGGDALEPQVAINNQGMALIVWGQMDKNSINNIYMSELRDGKWKHPAGLKDQISPRDPKHGSAGMPQVALDDKGNGIIAWMGTASNKQRIFLSEYRLGSWHHPASSDAAISPTGIRSAKLNYLEMDDNGNAIILWGAFKNRKQTLYKSEYRHGQWLHPQENEPFVAPLPQDFYFNVSGYSAMASNGRAVIAWWQSGSDGPQVYVAGYDHDQWYLPGRMLNVEGSLASGLTLSASAKGNIIIAWQQLEGEKEYFFSQVFKPVE